MVCLDESGALLKYSTIFPHPPQSKEYEAIADVKHLVWLAICRQYPFTYQFAIEVLAERYSKSQFQLYPEDYAAFLNAMGTQEEPVFILADDLDLTHISLSTHKARPSDTRPPIQIAAMPMLGPAHT